MEEHTESLEGFVVGAAALGIALDAAQEAACTAYVDLLMLWNERVNLLGPAAMRQIWSRHMLDALTLVLALPGDAVRGSVLSLVDIGSGAGFPGVPLQIAFPQWEVTLVEGTGKRARFLEEVTGALRLSSTLVVAQRAEEVAHDPHHRGAYDLAVARAVTHLAGLAELALPFVTIGGTAVLYKTLDAAHQELEDAEPARVIAGADPARILPVAPGVDTRCLVLYTKTRPTPSTLPRRAGMPEHQPLSHHDLDRIR